MYVSWILFPAMFAMMHSLAQALTLNVTAIGAQDGASTLECWQLNDPFSKSTQAGTAGSASVPLGDVFQLNYTVLPASFDGGLHNAPFNQWVVFITGMAHISLPEDNSTDAYISGGGFGLIFAADTANVSTRGHRTQYPGITETIALSIPTLDGEIPAHTLLHAGPCSANETTGLRNLATGSS